MKIYLSFYLAAPSALQHQEQCQNTNNHPQWGIDSCFLCGTDSVTVSNVGCNLGQRGRGIFSWRRSCKKETLFPWENTPFFHMTFFLPSQLVIHLDKNICYAYDLNYSPHKSPLVAIPPIRTKNPQRILSQVKSNQIPSFTLPPPIAHHLTSSFPITHLLPIHKIL